jgi:hypothetical protein
MQSKYSAISRSNPCNNLHAVLQLHSVIFTVLQRARPSAHRRPTDELSRPFTNVAMYVDAEQFIAHGYVDCPGEDEDRTSVACDQSAVRSEHARVSLYQLYSPSNNDVVPAGASTQRLTDAALRSADALSHHELVTLS